VRWILWKLEYWLSWRRRRLAESVFADARALAGLRLEQFNADREIYPE